MNLMTLIIILHALLNLGTITIISSMLMEKSNYFKKFVMSLLGCVLRTNAPIFDRSMNINFMDF